MDGSDNTTLLFAPTSPPLDHSTLPPNASSPNPGSEFPLAPSGSASPSPTPGPGSSSPAPSLFPLSWAPHEPPFWDTPLSHGLNVLVGAALCITMLGLGCTVDVTRFGAHVRRPVGALLAALCQFGLLPLLAFLLALACALDEVAAVAVLLCGCCPGGNLSNLMSLLVDGDMNLRYRTLPYPTQPNPTQPSRPPPRAPERFGRTGGAWEEAKRRSPGIEGRRAGRGFRGDPLSGNSSIHGAGPAVR